MFSQDAKSWGIRADTPGRVPARHGCADRCQQQVRQSLNFAKISDYSESAVTVKDGVAAWLGALLSNPRVILTRYFWVSEITDETAS
jgi:hypothetical protein